MALRTLTKINKNVVQNYCRTFSYKFDMTPTRPLQEQEEDAQTSNQQLPAEDEVESSQFNANTFRYSVCQQRTTPLEKPLNVANLMESQKYSGKSHITEQHLQPAQLPEYYNKQIDPSVNAPEGVAALAQQEGITKMSNQLNYRKFQESKTCANATLPLKSVKLANPFPEPVKQMYSRTVSDEEKAQQMLAESKSQRQFNDWSRITSLPPTRSFCTSSRRLFSSMVGSDSKKCKKLKKTDKKSACPRMTLPGCPPRPRVVCDRAPLTMDCKKQEAPYPAYSEFCHEDIDEKPSECKMCPWRPEENPNFKPQKKKFHTLSALNRRTGLEIVNELAKEHEHEVEQSGDQADQSGMYCDLRKPECTRPPRRPCAEKKDPKLKRKKKRVQRDEDSKRKDKKAKELSTFAQIMSQKHSLQTPQEQMDPECELDDVNAMNLAKKDPKKSEKSPSTGKCKKFRFPLCKEPKRKEDIPQEGSCPPRKKKPAVVDCPPKDDETRCSSNDTNDSEAMCYMMKKETEEDKKKKCPKIDLQIYRDEEEEEDRCKLRRGGMTKICPGDLLKKKRRPNKRKQEKKTSSPPLPARNSNERTTRPNEML